MVYFLLDASALSAQQRIDYIAELDRNVGIANADAENPLRINLYADFPERIILPPGVQVLSRHG